MSDNKTFCILPFVHLYAEPKGEMKPCCIAGGFDEPLNLKKMSLEDAFNSEQMRELRKDMLSGKRNKVCDICYKREDATGHSPRLQFNENTLWELPEVSDDYSVESQFQHIDIRFSNLCNFKCRMCSHDFSSNWYDDSSKVRPTYQSDKKILKVTDTISSDLKPHLSKIKSIYFAGGEPLIMPEHYETLKYLYDNIPITKVNTMVGTQIDTRNISIHYNTNLSVLKYDEQSLIDLWKGFKKVMLSVSCDGIGKVGEYQRTGFNTTRFEDNLKIIKKHANPVNVLDYSEGIVYNFQYTTTIMNVYHIFDFIDYMMDKKYVDSSEQIDFYYAWAPLEYSLSQISSTEKEKVIKFLESKIDNYSDKTKDELNRIIDFINSNVKTYEYELDSKKYIKKIDELHGGNFEEISKIIL